MEIVSDDDRTQVPKGAVSSLISMFAGTSQTAHFPDPSMKESAMKRVADTAADTSMDVDEEAQPVTPVRGDYPFDLSSPSGPRRSATQSPSLPGLTDFGLSDTTGARLAAAARQLEATQK